MKPREDDDYNVRIRTLNTGDLAGLSCLIFKRCRYDPTDPTDHTEFGIRISAAKANMVSMVSGFWVCFGGCTGFFPDGEGGVGVGGKVMFVLYGLPYDMRSYSTKKSERDHIHLDS